MLKPVSADDDHHGGQRLRKTWVSSTDADDADLAGGDLEAGPVGLPGCERRASARRRRERDQSKASYRRASFPPAFRWKRCAEEQRRGQRRIPRRDRCLRAAAKRASGGRHCRRCREQAVGGEEYASGDDRQRRMNSAVWTYDSVAARLQLTAGGCTQSYRGNVQGVQAELPQSAAEQRRYRAGPVPASPELQAPCPREGTGAASSASAGRRRNGPCPGGVGASLAPPACQWRSDLYFDVTAWFQAVPRAGTVIAGDFRCRSPSRPGERSVAAEQGERRCPDWGVDMCSPACRPLIRSRVIKLPGASRQPAHGWISRSRRAGLTMIAGVVVTVEAERRIGGRPSISPLPPGRRVTGNMTPLQPSLRVAWRGRLSSTVKLHCVALGDGCEPGRTR